MKFNIVIDDRRTPFRLLVLSISKITRKILYSFWSAAEKPGVADKSA